MSNTFVKFDIRNFFDHLQPSKEKGKFICPVCSGHNLGIDAKSGKYSCFNGCECRDIREALKPWSEVLKNDKNLTQKNNMITKAVAKPKFDPVSLPDGELVVVRLPETPTNVPQPQTPQILSKGVRDALAKKGCTQEEIAEATVTIYDYGDSKKVYRYDATCAESFKGREKTFLVSREIGGDVHWSKGDYTWSAYRQGEAVAAALAVDDGSVPVILAHEGEKCVEIARAEKLAGISAQGTPSENDWVCILNEMKMRMGDRPFIIAYCPDNDDTGRKKAETLTKAATRSQIPFVAVDLTLLVPNLCEKGDATDVLESGMTGDELAKLILEQIYETKAEQNNVAADDIGDFDDTLNPDIEFIQKITNFLYGDKPWISADDKLYQWQGNHYKHSPDSVERPKVASFCNSYIVMVPDGDGGFKPTFPYAKPSKVEEVLKWVKMRFEKDPNLLNPPGINCTNGVVQVRWENNKPVRCLEEYDPNKHYYIYKPLVKYDPEADTTDCDRLLQCLDEPQQQILLRNLGASIDLSEVRKRRGREVKVLLACGLGSNGKDALRQTVSTIFGHQGMTSVSLADFSHYDDGRKFALAPLLYSRVNWASENPQTARLDKIQSLKLNATGNMLHSEKKGKDHVEFIPKNVSIFNLNDVPALQGTIQAIQDRIAPLEFRKTFKINPDPNNPDELQADPRFAYDEDFVQISVAPAFLNKMLDALEALIEEGIDYDCTTNAFKSMQKENNHLFQLCEDIGLDYADSSVTAMDLWTKVERWYLDNGTLSIEGERRIWNDQVKPSDKNIKAPNQVIARFLAIFPKAKKSTKYCEIAKKNIPIIMGIGIITGKDSNKHSVEFVENTRPIDENTRPKSDPIPDPITLTNQDFRPTRPNFLKNESDEKEKDAQGETQLFNSTNEVEITKTGSGGSEPGDTNTSSVGTGSGIGSGNVNNGSGNVNNGSEQLNLEFDPLGNAQLVQELLEGEEAGLLLSDLLQLWTDEQKAAVKSHLQQPEIESVRNVIRQYNQKFVPTAANTPDADASQDLPIEYVGFLSNGDRVQCYPTLDHCSKDWKVSATVSDLQTEIQNGKRWLTSITLTWTYKCAEKTVKLGGGSVDWILRKV